MTYWHITALEPLSPTQATTAYIYEAAFYGVPLICIPIFLDQFSNCAQARSVGMAIGVDIKTVTGDGIYHSIQRIIQEPRYFHL